MGPGSRVRGYEGTRTRGNGLGLGFGQQARRMNGEGDMRLGDGKREENVEIKAKALRQKR